MAACRSLYRGNLRFSSRIYQYFREFHGLKGFRLVLACNLSTTQVCLKRTPHTVGVPAWARAGQRRRKELMEMEKPKSDKQIEAEFNLANDPTELNLYTTTKTGTPPSHDAAYESQIEKPKITMSADQTMFVCYHPAKPFPLQFSKDPGYHIWWHHDTDYMNSYRDQLTKKEVHEVRELRAKDAKVWTVTSLSNMLQVKPLAILLAAPLTDEQKLELEVERKLLTEWPKEQRKTYRANQELIGLRVIKLPYSFEFQKDTLREDCEFVKEGRGIGHLTMLLERLKYYHATRVAKSSESKETKKDNKRHTVPPARNAVV